MHIDSAHTIVCTQTLHIQLYAYRQCTYNCMHTDSAHTHMSCNKHCFNYSVGGMATRYGLGGPVIESQWGVRISAPV